MGWRGVAGGVFRALAALVTGVDPGDVQRHAQTGAHCAAMRGKVIGGSLQSVVNMNGADLPRPPIARRQQQGGGVGAATEGDRQGMGADGYVGQQAQGRTRGVNGALSARRTWCR
jgi:hypothetical protein